MVEEHVWIDGWCKHCGASEAGYDEVIASGGTSTCLQAKPSAICPEPTRRIYASEDFDAIGERLKELQILRDNPPVPLEEEGIAI